MQRGALPPHTHIGMRPRPALTIGRNQERGRELGLVGVEEQCTLHQELLHQLHIGARVRHDVADRLLDERLGGVRAEPQPDHMLRNPRAREAHRVRLRFLAEAHAAPPRSR